MNFSIKCIVRLLDKIHYVGARYLYACKLDAASQDVLFFRGETFVDGLVQRKSILISLCIMKFLSDCLSFN